MPTNARVIAPAPVQKVGHAGADHTQQSRFAPASRASGARQTKVSAAQLAPSTGLSPVQQLQADRDEARGLALGLLRLAKQHLDDAMVRDLEACVAAWGAR